MKRTSSVATQIVPFPSSRGRIDRATVRAHFESWLTEIAEDIDNDRAARLRDLVAASHLTQRKLADLVGVESRTVQRWLNGKGIAPENREPLAKALGRSVGYIMHGELEGPDPHDIIGRLDAIEESLAEIRAPATVTYADLARLPEQQATLAAAMAEIIEMLADIQRQLMPRDRAAQDAALGEGIEQPDEPPDDEDQDDTGEQP
jgi:transcriptional regulator with XRE-family HTH domain